MFIYLYLSCSFIFTKFSLENKFLSPIGQLLRITCVRFSKKIYIYILFYTSDVGEGVGVGLGLYMYENIYRERWVE